MTKKEVVRVLAVLKEAGVPFSNSNEDVLIELWCKCFEKIEYKDVSWAIYDLINSPEPLFLNGLIGKIKEKIVLKKNNFMDFNTVWNLILVAAHKTYPPIPKMSQEAFDSLPEMAKHLVGSVKQLENLEYSVKTELLETVVKSNMRKDWEHMIKEAVEDKIAGRLPIWEDKIRLQDQKVKNELLKHEVKKILENNSLDKTI